MTFKRWVYAYRYVDGPPSALEQLLTAGSGDLLVAATGSASDEPAADGSYVVELRSKVAGVEVAKKIRVVTGVAYRSGPRTVLPITWKADPTPRVFPAFDGTLELEALDARTSQLSLIGAYHTPLGPVGAAADMAGLRHVAQATAERLVAHLAAELGRAVDTPLPSEHVAGPRAGEPLRVVDVMTTDPLVIEDDLPLRSAALLLFHAEISAAPVISAGGELLGVLSEGDLLVKEAARTPGRRREEDRRRAARTAGQACTRPGKTTVPNAALTDVARRMLAEGVNRLVVVDKARIAGIVSRHDVLAALLRPDADIERAVRRVVDAQAGAEVGVEVQWGEVTLTGETVLRSVALRLPEAVAAVDGVVSVRAEGLTWEVDDEIPLVHV